jgi:hypothetical protein
MIASMSTVRSAAKTITVAKQILGRCATTSTAMHHGAVAIRPMGSVTDGVTFDTIAREWRCKWSTDDDKASLKAAQNILDDYIDEIKGTAGVKSVHRVVCGGNLDFKIIVALSDVEFKSWADVAFTPELSFLDKLKMVEGIHSVETQTYTFMEL